MAATEIDIPDYSEAQLLPLIEEGAPGREFFAKRSQSWPGPAAFAQLQDVLPTVVYNELWDRYLKDPAAFVAEWRMLAHEMRQGFIQHARHRLTSLTRLNQVGDEAFTPAWQEIQRALDAQQNDLLRAAFALELLELVEPAVLQATQFARVA